MPVVASEQTYETAIEGRTFRDLTYSRIDKALVKDSGKERLLKDQMLLMASQTLEMLSMTYPKGIEWLVQFITDTLEKYPVETLEDWALFLQEMRSGRLPKNGQPQFFGFGGRLDGVVLGEMWSRYMDAKSEMREGILKLRKENAYSSIAQNVASSVGGEKWKMLMESVDQMYDVHKQEEAAKASRKTKAHESHGLLLVEEAISVDHLRMIWKQYPYEVVRKACEAKAQALKSSSGASSLSPAAGTPEPPPHHGS